MTEPTPIPPVAPVTRSVQNKAMGVYITIAGTILTTCLTNEVIAQQLAARSYTAQRIGEGIALQNAAQTAYTIRQSSLGDRETAVDNQGDTFEHEGAEFESFRELARPFFTERGERTDLGLSGSMPQDMAAFVTLPRS